MRDNKKRKTGNIRWEKMGKDGGRRTDFYRKPGEFVNIMGCIGERRTGKDISGIKTDDSERK